MKVALLSLVVLSLPAALCLAGPRPAALECPPGGYGPPPPPTNPVTNNPSAGSPAGSAPSSPAAAAPSSPISASPTSPDSPRSTPTLPVTPRGKTAKKLLKLDWDYANYPLSERKEDGRTYAASAQPVQSYEEAVRFLAKDDPRPLLVVRECSVCSGTDRALLSTGVDNERTFLLARFFHCVKLPANVKQENHPLRALFAAQEPEHLFFCASDGSGKVALESERSRSELWQHMSNVLEQNYQSDMGDSIRLAFKLLDRLDAIDERSDHHKQEVARLRETDGPDSNKVQKAQAKLEMLERERIGVMDQIEKQARLPVRPRAALVPASAGATRP